MGGDKDINNSFRSSPPFHKIKKFLFSLPFCIPTSLLALILLLLLSYNGATIFYIEIPFSSRPPPESYSFSPEFPIIKPTQKLPSSSSSTTTTTTTTTSNFFSGSVMYAVKEENPPSKLKTQLPLLKKTETFLIQKPKSLRRSKSMFKVLQPTPLSREFSVRAKEFFRGSSSKTSCKVRFFMTWISSLNSFSDREFLTVESVFKSHPDACLLIVSSSMDSSKGVKLLRPFIDKGFRVSAISPDFDYLFKKTFAEGWFNQLKKGNVDPGEVSLGQNISNLLRLAILYKFGGIYIDTDVIVLKSFSNLRNTIGAQALNLETGNWSRLNNAVMIFDKNHPLLFKFIEEFTLTFNGNIWGHNGPYLVSRVVSRLSEEPGFNFTVLPPRAFYPLNWSKIRDLFRSPNDRVDSKWLSTKLGQIRKNSFAVHLWNKQSRNLKVEEGSIIGRLMMDCCIFCNSSVSVLSKLLTFS